MAAIRPEHGPKPFEVRFETPAGCQAQVDFARFVVTFTDEPSSSRIVWLFSLVLGHSRFIFARFVMHQDLQTLLRCHMQAFAAIGGVPIEILYDRMKTAVTGEDDVGHVIYNRSLLALAQHYGFHPKACRPYRAKTKGNVERPFSYIRQDFFLARTFRNLDDLNGQLDDWLATVANVRVHGTTQKVVAEAFAAEKPGLQALPATPFDALLRLERRVSHDGLVSIGGNYYSVPDSTRRVVEVHQLPDVIRILDQGRLVAIHPVLEGRRKTRVAPEHRQGRMPARSGVASTASKRASLRSRCRARSKCSMPLCVGSSRAEITWVDALDSLLVEELTLRDNRRVKTSLMMARLSAIKTLQGFDFTFQPSLDGNRILALAELEHRTRRGRPSSRGRPAPAKVIWRQRWQSKP